MVTEIEKKALALVNEVRGGRPYTIDEAKREYGWCFQAVCRAIEQHEAFRQEVSDAVEEWHGRWVGAGESHSYFMSLFARFIIAKPDPLVEAVADIGCEWEPEDANKLRAALAARGLKIVEDK